MVSGFPVLHLVTGSWHLARECFQGGDTMRSITPPHGLTIPTNRHTLSMSLARCNKCSLDMPATLRLAVAPHGLLEPAIWRSKTGAGKSSCSPLSCAHPPL